MYRHVNIFVYADNRQSCNILNTSQSITLHHFTVPHTGTYQLHLNTRWSLYIQLLPTYSLAVSHSNIAHVTAMTFELLYSVTLGVEQCNLERRIRANAQSIAWKRILLWRKWISCEFESECNGEQIYGKKLKSVSFLAYQSLYHTNTWTEITSPVNARAIIWFYHVDNVYPSGAQHR